MRGEVVLPTARDLDVLRLLGEQCALSQPQLARAMGIGEEAVRKIRRRWQRAGWTRTGRFLAGRPPVVWLTGRGHRIAGVWFKPWRPDRLSRLDHIVAAAEARIYVAERKPTARWICERELMRRDRLARVRNVHRPDALVETELGVAAVEVQLTIKPRRHFESVAVELLSRYDALWYFAPQRLLGRLEDRFREAGLLDRLQLVELPDPWRRA